MKIKQSNPDSISLRVFTSPEWKLWCKEVQRRMTEHSKKGHKHFTGCWDVDESMELGLMSEGHWKDFIKFVKTLK